MVLVLYVLIATGKADAPDDSVLVVMGQADAPMGSYEPYTHSLGHPDGLFGTILFCSAL